MGHPVEMLKTSKRRPQSRRNGRFLSYLVLESGLQTIASILGLIIISSFFQVVSCNAVVPREQITKHLAAIKAPLSIPSSAEEDAVTPQKLALFINVLKNIVYNECASSDSTILNKGELNSLRTFLMRLILVGNVEGHQIPGSHNFESLYRNLTSCSNYLFLHPIRNRKQDSKHILLAAAGKKQGLNRDDSKTKPAVTTKSPPTSAKPASFWKKSMSKLDKAIRPLTQATNSATKKIMRTTSSWASSFYNTAKGLFGLKRQKRDLGLTDKKYFPTKSVEPKGDTKTGQIRIQNAYQHFVRMLRNMSFLTVVECPKHGGFMVDSRTMKGVTDLLSSWILGQLVKLEKQGVHVKISQNLEKSIQKCVKHRL